MPIAHCPACGVRYRLPENAAGKRTKCKKCGEAFRIALAPEPAPPAAAPAPAPEEPIKLVDLAALADGETVRAPRASAAAEGDPYATRAASALALSALPAQASWNDEYDEPHATGAAAYAHYIASVVKGAFFFRKPANVLTFLGVWLLLAVRELLSAGGSFMPLGLGMGFLGLGAFVIRGWYMAFQMNLVVWAAGEDDKFPDIVAEGDFWDGVVIPFWRMLSTYIFAFLPIAVFLWIVYYRLAAAVAASPAAQMSGASPTPGVTTILVLIAISLVELFFWPMMVLVVSVGGSASAMFRFDLIGETILKSFPAYLITVLAVYVSFGMNAAVTAYLWARVGPTENAPLDYTNLVLIPTLFVGVNLFFDILAMRAIGYYYSCFKHKFAWSWG